MQHKDFPRLGGVVIARRGRVVTGGMARLRRFGGAVMVAGGLTGCTAPKAVSAIAVGSAATPTVAAIPAPVPCILPRMQPMLSVELYMGSDIAGRAPVRAAEWDGFVAREIGPRFADGFSVIDATGQWLSPNTGKIGREASHVVRIWTMPGPELAAKLTAIAAAYKAAFRQEAVGVSVTEGCARFSE